MQVSGSLKSKSFSLPTTDTEKGANPMSTSLTNIDSTILAVGAAGPFAGLVVPELAKRSAKVRGVSPRSQAG